jgi:hypothetical protein
MRLSLAVLAVWRISLFVDREVERISEENLSCKLKEASNRD